MSGRADQGQKGGDEDLEVSSGDLYAFHLGTRTGHEARESSLEDLPAGHLLQLERPTPHCHV